MARRRELVLAAAAALAAACGKETPPAPPDAPRPAMTLPKELESAEKTLASMSEQTRLDLEQDAATRKELVTPAPPGFVPKTRGRKLDLALIPQKTMIRLGESFWYRAEITNVGTEPFEMRDSFINSGSGGDGWSKFRLMISPSTPQPALWGDAGEPCMFEHPPVPGWERMSESERKAATERWAREEAVPKWRINVRLAPGETIRTRDWRAVSREDACAAWKAGNPSPERPGGLFREFEDRRQFARPGSYTVKLVYDDPGKSPSAGDLATLKKMGRDQAHIDSYIERFLKRPPLKAESRSISLEVVGR